MLLSRLHKIWISCLVIASLAMSGVVSASMMSMPTMMMASATMTTNDSHHSNAASGYAESKVDCHSSASAQDHVTQSPSKNKSQSHCDKLMASDCCPAVCVSLGLLSPTTQLMARQPHRSKLPSEASVTVIARASSLYRPPIS
ncbi:hypothetical protein [Motilimonas eburnea]|uniref:hypothetical protein n=1 Tax=Motilimonas eburnea TaxID=1737488 RepID=UPI001E4999C7|nr:hypothetical protein [Motilimonas eburnea]MCE2571310.1 hypothetical protein [Motilimonas eburnea]